jgi:alpha-tubulin suppressor-like RCC1 family protein
VAGQNHSFVIDEDNNLICWGDNSHGQLGKGNKMTTSEIIMHSEKVLDVASKGL